MELAPIGISTYSRIDHLKETIEALQKNTLAKESELYIFSDAPRKGDEKIVQRVRDYINTIDGFKKVYVIKREINGRISNNRGGAKQLLDEYGKMIFLEDDIVTAPGFLKFMNECLELYKDRDDVLSICGYSPSININIDFPYDSFFFQKFIGWGLGIWKNKLGLVKPIEEEKYLSFIKDQANIEYIIKNCGQDSLKNFEDECYSNNNHFDVQASFLECVENLYTVYPKYSLVNNMGHDGSGLHSGITDKFKTKLWDKTENFILSNDIERDESIKKSMAAFFSRDENDVDSSVVDSIINKIIESKLTSFSIWGTGILTDLLLKELKNSNIIINNVLCSWAKENTYYNNQKVITPQEALDNGEENFIIASFGSRFKMRDIIAKMTKKDINIIMS